MTFVLQHPLILLAYYLIKNKTLLRDKFRKKKKTKKLQDMVVKRINFCFFKESSFIHKVDYKGIVDELWNTTIDENKKDEDKYIKKLIGNVD